MHFLSYEKHNKNTRCEHVMFTITRCEHVMFTIKYQTKTQQNTPYEQDHRQKE